MTQEEKLKKRLNEICFPENEFTTDNKMIENKFYVVALLPITLELVLKAFYNL